MNLTQAEAIASLYKELIESIDQERIPVPIDRTYQGERPWPRSSMGDISIEDGQVKVEWSKYVGCGDYDTYTSYHPLHTLFD